MYDDGSQQMQGSMMMTTDTEQYDDNYGGEYEGQYGDAGYDSSRIAVEQVGDRVLVPVEVDRDGGQARQMAASGVKYSGRGKLLSFCFMSIKCRPTATIL